MHHSRTRTLSKILADARRELIVHASVSIARQYNSEAVPEYCILQTTSDSRVYR